MLTSDARAFATRSFSPDLIRQIFAFFFACFISVSSDNGHFTIRSAVVKRFGILSLPKESKCVSLVQTAFSAHECMWSHSMTLLEYLADERRIRNVRMCEAHSTAAMYSVLMHVCTATHADRTLAAKSQASRGRVDKQQPSSAYKRFSDLLKKNA